MRRLRVDLDRADTFVCVGCKRTVPSSFGCDDNMPDHCDDCWKAVNNGATDIPLGPANDRGVPDVEMRLAESIARTGGVMADQAADYWIFQDVYDRSQQVQRTRRRRP